MSHINEFMGIMRGLWLVAEAGAKVQQEAFKTLWLNSSVPSLVQACPTNPLTASKVNSELIKDVLERALVVAHGFRHYAIMHVPNLSTVAENKADMDPRMKEEIEELNREFNNTFENLKKKETTAPMTSSVDYVAPLENIRRTDRQVEPDTVDNIRTDSDAIKHQPITTMTTKPVAKKKIRVSVSI